MVVTINLYLQKAKRIQRGIHEELLTSTPKNYGVLDLDTCESEIRPTQDGEFESSQLGDNSSNLVNIGTILSP